jgi:Zn-finger nucleic acid-binding protein
MSDTKGVEIDYCPNCRGVWLDRGELEKIIERSNAYGSQNFVGKENYDHQENQYEKQHDSHYDNHYDKHQNDHRGYGDQPRRKKGFLGELFDF